MVLATAAPHSDTTRNRQWNFCSELAMTCQAGVSLCSASQNFAASRPVAGSSLCREKDSVIKSVNDTTDDKTPTVVEQCPPSENHPSSHSIFSLGSTASSGAAGNSTNRGRAQPSRHGAASSHRHNRCVKPIPITLQTHTPGGAYRPANPKSIQGRTDRAHRGLARRAAGGSDRCHLLAVIADGSEGRDRQSSFSRAQSTAQG